MLPCLDPRLRLCHSGQARNTKPGRRGTQQVWEGEIGQRSQATEPFRELGTSAVPLRSPRSVHQGCGVQAMCSFISPDLGLYCSQVPTPNLAPLSCPLTVPRGIRNLFHPSLFTALDSRPFYHTPMSNETEARCWLSPAVLLPSPIPSPLEAFSPASCLFHEGYEGGKPLGMVSPGPPSPGRGRAACMGRRR